MNINANLRRLHMLLTHHPLIRPLLRATILLAALCSLLMFAACQSMLVAESPKPSAVILPNAVDVVPEPVSRPSVAVGDDLGIVARRAYSYGDLNAKRLRDARQNYESVRDAYSKN